jgi:hypothetical protein
MGIRIIERDTSQPFERTAELVLEKYAVFQLGEL